MTDSLTVSYRWLLLQFFNARKPPVSSLLPKKRKKTSITPENAGLAWKVRHISFIFWLCVVRRIFFRTSSVNLYCVIKPVSKSKQTHKKYLLKCNFLNFFFLLQSQVYFVITRAKIFFRYLHFERHFPADINPHIFFNWKNVKMLIFIY